jgi:peptidoglycan/xylan/chitin deacetylase (PgdA/CDA1 family)
VPSVSTSLFRYFLTASSPGGRRARLSILIFHRVLPHPDPLFPGEIDAQRFGRITSWLGEWCNILPLSEAIHGLRRGTLPARAACLTFDDGYADNHTHALPILQRHGIHATFFVATGFLNGGRMWNDTLIEAVRATRRHTLDLTRLGLGVCATRSPEEKRHALATLIPALKHLAPSARVEATAAVAELCDAPLPNDLMLSTDQLRALHAAGMGIGAHTVSHPILARCDEQTARREIADSRAQLEALLGEPVRLFAYPNGKLGADYTAAHARMVRELGFDAALSTNAGASRHGDDLFQLPRFTPWGDRLRFGFHFTRNLLRRSAI